MHLFKRSHFHPFFLRCRCVHGAAGAVGCHAARGGGGVGAMGCYAHGKTFSQMAPIMLASGKSIQTLPQPDAHSETCT